MRKYQNFDHKNNWQDSDVEDHWDKVAGIYISSRDCEADDYIKSSFPSVSVINAEISQRLIDVVKKSGHTHNK